MELSKIKDIILKEGYYEFSPKHKAILRLDVYERELKKILEKEITSAHKESFPFGVFRGNLFHYGLGKGIEEDYELYLQHIRHQQIHNLQKGVLLLPQQIKVEFSNDEIENQYNRCWELSKTMVITSFHFSSYKLIINYLLSKNCDLYLLATGKVITENESPSNVYLSISNDMLGYNSTITYIDAEKPTSLINLVNKLKDNESHRPKILLVFPDGNIGGTQEIKNSKNKIQFLGKEVLINKGVMFFAELLNLPVFKVVADSNEHDIKLKILESYMDIKGKDLDILTNELFHSFEATLTQSNIFKWECIMYLYNWLAYKPVEHRSKTPITSDLFENNRFTKLHIKNTHYLFDSKYYLSYAFDSSYLAIKDFVLDKKIAL